MATKKTPIPANFETDIPEWQPGMQWSDDTLQRWGAIDAQNRLETQAAQPTGFLRGAADLGLGVAQGVTGLATGLGSVYGLATGDMDNPLRTSAASAGDYLQGLESPTLRARRQLANQAIEGQDGVWAQAWEAAKQYVTDPRLLSSELTKQIALMAPALVAGRAVSGLARGAAGAEGLGTGTAVGVSGIQQGAEVASDTFDRAIKGGASETKALDAARTAFLAATAASVVSQYAVPGGTTIERVIAGRAGAAGLPRGVAGRFGAGVVALAGESGQEGFEEGMGALSGNAALRDIGQPVDLLEGVGPAVGMGAALGGALGGPMGVVGFRPELEDTPPAADPSIGGAPPPSPAPVGGPAPITPDSGAIDLLDKPTFLRRGLTPDSILPTERQQVELDLLGEEAAALRIRQANEESQYEALAREAARLRGPQSVDQNPPDDAGGGGGGLTQVESLYPSELTAPPVPPTIVRTGAAPQGEVVRPGQIQAAPATQPGAEAAAREGGPIDADTQYQILTGIGPVEAFSSTFQYTLNTFGGEKGLAGGVRPIVGNVYMAVNKAKQTDRLKVLARAIDAQETSKNKNSEAASNFLKAWYEELTGVEYNGNPFPAPGEQPVGRSQPVAAPVGPDVVAGPAAQPSTRTEVTSAATTGLRPAARPAQQAGERAPAADAPARAGVGADVRAPAVTTDGGSPAPADAVPGRTGTPGPRADEGGGLSRQALDETRSELEAAANEPLETRIHLLPATRYGAKGQEVADGWYVMDGTRTVEHVSSKREAERVRRQIIAEKTAEREAAAAEAARLRPRSALPTADDAAAPAPKVESKPKTRAKSAARALADEVSALERQIAEAASPQERTNLRSQWANKKTQLDRLRDAEKIEAKQEPVAKPAERQTMRKTGELPATVNLRAAGMGVTASEQKTRRDMEAAERRLLVEANDETTYSPAQIKELESLAERIRTALSDGRMSTEEYTALGDEVARALGEDEPLFSVRAPGAGSPGLTAAIASGDLNGALDQIAASSVTPRNQRIARLLRALGLRTRTALGPVPAGGLASWRRETGKFELFHWTTNPTVGTAANPFRIIRSETEASQAGGIGDQWFDVGFYTALAEQQVGVHKMYGSNVPIRDILEEWKSKSRRIEGARRSATYRANLVPKPLSTTELVEGMRRNLPAWVPKLLSYTADGDLSPEYVQAADAFAFDIMRLFEQLNSALVVAGLHKDASVGEAAVSLMLKQRSVAKSDSTHNKFDSTHNKFDYTTSHIDKLNQLVLRASKPSEYEFVAVAAPFLAKMMDRRARDMKSGRTVTPAMLAQAVQDELYTPFHLRTSNTLLRVEFDAVPEEILRWDVDLLAEFGYGWWMRPFKSGQSQEVQRALVKLGVLETLERGEVRFAKMAASFISNIPQLRDIADNSHQSSGLFYHAVATTQAAREAAVEMHSLVYGLPRSESLAEIDKVSDYGTIKTIVDDLHFEANNTLGNYDNPRFDADRYARVDELYKHFVDSTQDYNSRRSLEAKALAARKLREQGVKGGTHYDNYLKGRALVIYDPARDARVVKRRVKVPGSYVRVNTHGHVFDARRVGMYDPVEDLMVLDSRAVDEQLILHETTHAATEHKIRAWRDGADLPADEAAALRGLEQLYLQAKGAIARRGKANVYGLSSLSEFVAEAWSNADFQADLKSLGASGKELSLWQRLVRLVRRILGLGEGDTALERADAFIEQIISAPGTEVDGKPVYMYAGVNAVDANIGRVELAEMHELSGSDPETVRLMTGWFRGTDGMWRFELDDSAARWTKPFAELADTKVLDDPVYTLADVLHHPELFAAYPELADVQFAKQGAFFDITGSVQGSFNAEQNLIKISPYASDPLGTLLHEIQHWVQFKEGFASGGNNDTVKLTDENALRAAQAHIQRTVQSKFASKEYDPVAREMFGAPLRDLTDPVQRLDVVAKAVFGKPWSEFDDVDIRYLGPVVETRLNAEKERVAREFVKAQEVVDTIDRLLAPENRTRLAKAYDDYATTVQKYTEVEQELAAFEKEAAREDAEWDARYKKAYAEWEAAGKPAGNRPSRFSAAQTERRLVRMKTREELYTRRRSLQETKAKKAEAKQALFKELLGEQDSLRYTLYRLLAGEVEARDTAARREMSAPDRLLKGPGTSIPPEEQIVMRSVDEQGDVLYSERPAAAATNELSAKAREMLEAGKANTTDSAGRLWLSTLPLDRVAADYGKDVRGLKPLVDAIFQKEAFATAKATDVDRWVRQFEQLADRQALEDLLYDANERGVFPHLSMEEQAAIVKRRTADLMRVEKLTKTEAKDVLEGYHDDLSARFERLTPDARKLYRTIIDELEARRQTLQQALERFITVMEHDGTARKTRIAQLRRRFNKIKGPYFPVLRFGNFGVAAYASDGKLLEFVLVESRSQQARAAEFLKARHKEAKIQEFKQAEMHRLIGGVSDNTLVDDMQKMVARSVEDTQLRATLQREMQKIFISALPEYHARQRFLPRRFVPGARRDAPRSFGRAMLSSLRYEAQLRFNPRIQGALKDLADFASGKPSRRHAYLVSIRTTDGNATAELYESQEAARAALGDAFDRGTLDTYRIATLTSDAAKARADATNVLGLLSNAERDALLDPMLERAAAVTGRPVPPNTNIARDIETEVRKRMNAIVDSDTPPTIQFLGNLTYLYHLGVTPSFVLANLSQNPLVTLPMLAAKFGMGRSARAMGKYAKQVAADMRGPFKSGWRTGSFDVAKLTSVTPEQRRLLEHLLANNLLDLTQSLDLGRAVEGSGKASEMWQKVMRYGTLTGHYSEIFNRVVAALTALELANERAGSAGLETEAARFEYVRNVISRTHMNYSAINRPGLMTRSQLTRLMFQFRTYAFGMTHHILRMFNDAIRGESAEIKAEARRMLFYSVGTGLLAAGLRGLPFYSAYILAAAALGIDDPEREMAGYITKLTGSKDVAETLLRGPMYLAGGDMSERIGLGSVIPFTNLFGQQTMGPTDSALTQATFDLVMGPFGGIAKNALVTAPEHWSNGDPWRAAELVVPKFIRDPMQAVRWADEGVQTRRGDVIMAADALGVGDYFWKAAGVQPAEVARLYDERGQMFKLRDQIAKGKSRYLIRYRAAVMQGDMEEAAQIREEAAQAAREDRSLAIKPRQWVDAVRRQSARNLLLESTGGLAATKDERRLLEMLIDEVE